MIGHYLEVPPLDEFIVHAKLGNDAGTMGCLLLAREKLELKP